MDAKGYDGNLNPYIESAVLAQREGKTGSTEDRRGAENGLRIL